MNGRSPSGLKRASATWWTGLAVVIAIAAAVAVANQYLAPTLPDRSRDAAAESQVRDAATTVLPGRDPATTAVGTSGLLASVPPATIEDIETITGTVDGHELIGRRVDVSVSVVRLANQVAFWAGPRDNNVLVVMRRTTGKRTARAHDDPATHHVLAVRPGERARITGTIQQVPEKAMDSWGWRLTDDERRDLGGRNIYIRADTVVPAGHGT